jgi:hypothetical protein
MSQISRLPSAPSALVRKIAEAECWSSLLDSRVQYSVRGAPSQNFGDLLPAFFATTLLLSPRVEADVYRLIGSVIDSKWARRDRRQIVGTARGIIAYWCCGLRQPSPLDNEARAASRFFGVRGPLARDVLGLPPATVLGDPGLLVPILHQVRPAELTRGRSICVPHFQDDRSDVELLHISGADVVVRPWITARITEVGKILDLIASASSVLSASLHRAIAAFAYQRPVAFWSNGIIELPFKWADFAASVSAPTEFAGNVARGREVYEDQLVSNLRHPPLTPILEVCPFIVRPAARLRALVHDCAIDRSASIESALPLLDEMQSTHCRAIAEALLESDRVRASRARLSESLVRSLGRRIGSAASAVKRKLISI